MLLLSRKEKEKLVIGDNIVVTVVRIDSNRVRIGIESPTDVSIRREEIAPLPKVRGTGKPDQSHPTGGADLETIVTWPSEL
jgi:carbon storage regulator